MNLNIKAKRCKNCGHDAGIFKRKGTRRTMHRNKRKTQDSGIYRYNVECLECFDLGGMCHNPYIDSKDPYLERSDTQNTDPI